MATKKKKNMENHGNIIGTSCHLILSSSRWVTTLELSSSFFSVSLLGPPKYSTVPGQENETAYAVRHPRKTKPFSTTTHTRVLRQSSTNVIPYHVTLPNIQKWWSTLTSQQQNLCFDPLVVPCIMKTSRQSLSVPDCNAAAAAHTAAWRSKICPNFRIPGIQGGECGLPTCS